MESLTKEILFQSSGIEDWTAFYADLEKKANIPNASSFESKAGKIVFRNSYLNLQEVKDIVDDIEGVVNVVLYTDTLEIPEFTKWVINKNSLIIYARNIIVHDYAGILLDFQDSQVGKLVVIGREFNNRQVEVKCIFDTEESPDIYYLDASNATSGTMISAKEKVSVLQQLTLAETTRLFPEQDLSFYLNNAFIYASVLSDQDESLALSMLLWVKSLASQSVSFQNLFYRVTSLASLLQSQIKAKENGARFVPYLSATVYENLAESFVNVAAHYEDLYTTLSVEESLTEQNIDEAKTMVSNAEAEINFVNALLDQAKQKSAEANEAVKEAMKNFEDQNLIVKLIAIDFETVGIPEYKKKVIMEGMFDIITSLVTFGVSIGLMATGAGAGAGVAGAGASVATVSQVAKSGVETASMAKTLAETMEKLSELIEKIKEAIELAQSIKQVVDNVATAENQMATIQQINDFYDEIDLTASDNWTIFELQASNAMEDPIALGIGFAKEYDEAMKILAIYGQSLSAAQVASIKADQELAAIFFQLEYAQEKKKNLEVLVDKLEVGQAMNLEMKQQLFQKHLDHKSSLFSALTSYKQSFFYWSFTNSLIQPKIIESVNQIGSGLEELTQITMDEVTALDQFNPPPQLMKNFIFSVEDKAIIQRLKSEQETSWVLPINDPEFQGLERVRLDNLRVWIEGVTFENNEDSVFITITNTGNYLDCYKKMGYQFNSKPLVRTFKYKVMDSPLNADWKFDNHTWGLVQIDGEVDQEVKYAYFRPTPFSEWKISLKSNNTGIDLSKVSKITMYFEGTAIGTTEAHSLQLREKAILNISV